MGKKPKGHNSEEKAEVKEFFIRFVVGAYRLSYRLLGPTEKKYFLQRLIQDPQGLVLHTVNRIDKLMVIFMINQGVREPILIDDMTSFCEKVVERLKQNLAKDIESLNLELVAK